MKRILSAVILGFWMIPTAGALALDLHLVLDHHGSRGTAHPHDHADPVAAHGHHHDPKAAPDHNHDHVQGVECLASTLRPSAAPVAPELVSISPRVVSNEGRALMGWCLRCGQTVPLFTTHCALLI